MITRIISAAVALSLFIAVSLAPLIVLNFALVLICGVAIFEIYRAFSYLKYKWLSAAAFLSAALFPFAEKIPSVYLIFYVLFLTVTAALTMLLRHKEFKSADLAAAVFYPVLVSASLSVICCLRSMENGGFYFWLPFAAAWSTDTFAYFTGKLFGKKKLCEKLSPKKTVEGALGGICGAIIAILIFCRLIPGETAIWAAIIYAVAASVLSQTGDIFASCIKREHGIKDFGNIMPGHGGVMDRFDSVILTAPFTYLFIMITGINGG